jgi:sugar O-acyltransferase (sialic acid O-acetyltransferase NeuD family)
MRQRIVVIGAGGFGREALDVIEAMNRGSANPVFEVVGVVDDQPSSQAVERLADRKVPLLGSIDQWLESPVGDCYVIGVGSPQARARIAARFEDLSLAAAVLIHPAATVGSRPWIGSGSVICGGAQVSTNVRLGRHAHVNPNATIGHDAVVGDFVSINPAATVSGDVTIGRESLVGAGSVVLQGLTIGEGCTIGASACVTREVFVGATVRGVPAR